MGPQATGNDMDEDNEDKIRSAYAFANPEAWSPVGLLNTLLMDANIWLTKKKNFDGHGKLWRVHDNLYDLSSYIDKHPGGSDWLSLTQGTDITELFMSSHIVNVSLVESVLKKFYVKPAEGPRKTPYTFNENDFYMTLKRRAEPVLKKSGTGSSIEAKLVQDGLGLGFIICGILGTIFNSNLLLILSGLSLFCSTACAHNFFHLKDTWRKYYFDLSLLSSFDFRITHSISHHIFPNTLLDFEATVTEPVFVFRHVKSKWLWQRYGPPIYLNVICLVGLKFNYLLKMFRILILREHSLRPENLIPVLEYFVLAAIAPSFSSAALSWLVIHTTCSYVILMVGYTAAHHDTTCFHDGDHMRKNPDWGMCQMDATRDTRTDFSDNLLLTSVTFGEHPLHHLFPTVCHSKHHLLKPIMIDTMKEFGMDYPRLTRFELFLGTLWNFAKNTPNFFCSNSNNSSAKAIKTT